MSSIAFGQDTPVSCVEATAQGGIYLTAHLPTRGTDAVEMRLSLPDHHAWLIEVEEEGNDALAEILDPAGNRLATADHPERRTGTRRIILAAETKSGLTLRVSGKEHATVAGAVDVRVFDLAKIATLPVCTRAYHEIAAADGDYAVAQEISLGRRPAGRVSTHDLYVSAAQHYETAHNLLDAPADVELKGEIDLGLAGLWYYNLQGWRRSAEWAHAVANLSGYRNPYRRARAQAISAAAWIEMATDAETPATSVGHTEPHTLLRQARRVLERLSVFHRRRGEPYDEALQVNNIALSYFYEGRSEECVIAARTASRLFARLHENPRQALALQNQALCEWGMGHLPQALGSFNLALKYLQPAPYPQLYLPALNNTALLNFALGHLDESLRLHDRALDLAMTSQNPREEAQSLYGIGVTYYALGDRELAADFLERSLAIRTAAFDGRGRRATLRSLATLYADRGSYREAIDCDRESLTLASDPLALALSRIQLAAHTALAGRTDEALATFDALIRPGAVRDALVVAQARLARAEVRRGLGYYRSGLEDLRVAIPVFHRIGTVTDQFSSDLERARILQQQKRWPESLAAVNEALSHADSLRTQTANPELRAQVQLPLRAAYDLKLDLLWDQYQSAETGGDLRQAARMAAMAFQVADSARAQSFEDLSAQQYSSSVQRDLESPLARREAIYHELVGLQFSLDSRLDLSGSADPHAIRLRSEIAERQRQVDTLNSVIAAHSTGVLEPPIKGGRRGRHPLESVPSMPADSAVVAYWIGSQSAYAWALTPASLQWVRLTDPHMITTAARTFHDSLKGLAEVPRAQRIEAAEHLYDLVLRPLDRWIALYARWYMVPDAALTYVPFAALRGRVGDAVAYVIASHDIALTPAVRLLYAQLRPSVVRPPDRALLVSDPVYDPSDPRLAGAAISDRQGPRLPGASAAIAPSRQYRRLPATAGEASTVRAELGRIPSDAFAGFAANRAELLTLDWSRYRFIHVASHGLSDARIPQLSALMLSAFSPRGERVDNALRAADLSTLRLAAEVAVFSGCETALGKEVLSEGMVGLSYTALARGARAVVSSLWTVPDEMTATLMTEFYRHLLRDSMSPTSALSAALRSALLRNPLADPALWAAFQISVVDIPRQ